MIHYHGTPITPETAAVEALTGAHALVSFAHPAQLGLCQTVCQSYVLDNGAFSAWKSGKPKSDWEPYAKWVAGQINHPRFDWAIMPDVIEGTEDDNDGLIRWFARRPGLRERPHCLVPVWHLHESTERLRILVRDWPRVALGSSGAFAVIDSDAWRGRMTEAMAVLCHPSGEPKVKIHGLRMLSPDVYSRFPFASADSCNIARNVGLDGRWARGSYAVTNKAARARIIRGRIEHAVSPSLWVGSIKQADFDWEEGASEPSS